MTMENADSRAFVKDVKRIIIKVVALSVSCCSIGFYCLDLRECSGCFSVRLLLSSGPCLQ